MQNNRNPGPRRPSDSAYSSRPGRSSAPVPPVRRPYSQPARTPAAPVRTSRPQGGPQPRYSAVHRGRARRQRRQFLLKRLYLIIPAAVILAALILVPVLVLRRPAKDQLTMSVQTPTATPAAQPTEAPSAEPSVEPTADPGGSSIDLHSLEATYITEFNILENIPNTDRALGLPECARVRDSYFNNTVFVGDSVSEKLKVYISNARKEEPELLGNSIFLTATSYSSRNALKEVTDTSLHPSFRGVKMKTEDIIAQLGAEKVYVMLGMNDVGISGYKDSARNLITFLGEIKKKSPDIKIFVQSATPRMSGSRPTTEQLFKYNMLVYKYCQRLVEQDVYFVDVGYIMRDAEGKLQKDYCSDPDGMAIHFTNTACKKWIDYLYTHALPEV